MLHFMQYCFFYIGHSINAKEDLNKINFNLTLHKTLWYKVCQRFFLPNHLQTFTWKRSRLKSEIWSPGSTHWKMAKTRGSAGNFKRDSAAHKILLLSRLIFHDPDFSCKFPFPFLGYRVLKLYICHCSYWQSLAIPRHQHQQLILNVKIVGKFNTLVGFIMLFQIYFHSPSLRVRLNLRETSQRDISLL